jgi:hypothetical protein
MFSFTHLDFSSAWIFRYSCLLFQIFELQKKCRIAVNTFRCQNNVGICLHFCSVLALLALNDCRWLIEGKTWDRHVDWIAFSFDWFCIQCSISSAPHSVLNKFWYTNLACLEIFIIECNARWWETMLSAEHCWYMFSFLHHLIMIISTLWTRSHASTGWTA